MTRHVHVFPVPPGMTPDEAWAEICAMGRLVEPAAESVTGWSTISCDGVECQGIDLAPADDYSWHADLCDDERRSLRTPTQAAIEDLGEAITALADALWRRLADLVVPPGCCW